MTGKNKENGIYVLAPGQNLQVEGKLEINGVPVAAGERIELELDGSAVKDSTVHQWLSFASEDGFLGAAIVSRPTASSRPLQRRTGSGSTRAARSSGSSCPICRTASNSTWKSSRIWTT